MWKNSIKTSPNQCSVCGKIIDKSNNLCLRCENEKRRLIAIEEREARLGITRSTFKNEIRTTSFSQLGKQYGVSSKTISNWCKTYNLPSKKTEIKKYTDKEWEKI